MCRTRCDVLSDPRVERLADILVHHSTKLQAGEVVSIMGPPEAKPLILACYRNALDAGAHARISVSFEETELLLLRHGSQEQLEHLDSVRKFEADTIDVAIRVRASSNTRALSNSDTTKMATVMTAARPVMNQIIENVRWVLCDYPTQAFAQEAEMALDEYANFLFGATNIDWTSMEADLKRIKSRLESGKEVRIVGPETDLTLGIEGRIWETAAGTHNMPDGEIFTAPIEDAVNGCVTYEFPAVYQGREVRDIRLNFVDGTIVEATASKGQEFLTTILDTDEGARRLGEIGIGTNFGIQRHTRNILFDEKMGGTVHLAVGRAYEFTGGRNKSAVHWDMIKDLRTNGALYLDGALIQENGKFLI